MKDFPTVDKAKCERSSEHQAHMAMNGECPWCGHVDESKIREDLSIEQIESMFG